MTGEGSKPIFSAMFSSRKVTMLWCFVQGATRVPWNWKWKASTVSKLANTLQCLRQTLAYYGHIAFHVWSLPPLSCRREPHGCCFCSFARSSSQLSVAVDLLKIVITQGNKGGSTDHKWGYPWITHFNRISTINHPAIGGFPMETIC